MTSRFIVFLVVIVSLVAGFGIYRFYRASRQDMTARRQALNLVVFTHSSFMDAFGPGQEIKELFEKKYEATVEYVDAGGTALVLEKLKLTPDRRVDVVLGLNLLLLETAARTVQFKEIDRAERHWVEAVKPYVYATFLPYDWSEMGFIFRKNETTAVKSWAEALAKFPESSVSLQDPGLSTPGLTFLFWIFSTQPNLDEFLTKWNSKIHTISPGWSQAYGLFKKGQSKITFSYLTSLIYHWSEEKDHNYAFMPFEEGHPVEIEYAAVPEACWNCGLAQRFVDFLTEPEAQKILMNKNFMRPVRTGLEVSTVYAELPTVNHLKPQELDRFSEEKDKLLSCWQQVMRAR